MPLTPNPAAPSVTPLAETAFRTRRRQRHQLLLLIFLLLLIATLAVALAARQKLSDWWRLHGYQPPANVVQLADQDTMTAYTRHLFYLNRPQLLSTVAGFRSDCSENENTIVLGCYHFGQNGIFIYDITDPTLAGVTQVTAAHEVLHAIYARLSTKDRSNLDSQLEDFYKHDLKDPQVQAEVKLYQQTEPGDVMDEMSCTFGTEVADLPAGLEAYYKHYFTDRAAIVAYEQQYDNAFTTRQATVSQDDAKLTTMQQQLNVQEQSLEQQQAQIQANETQLNALQNSGQIAAFNSGVPAYNSEVDAYNSAYDQLQNLVASYNQLIDARNQANLDLNTLAKAVDTRLAPQNSR